MKKKLIVLLVLVASGVMAQDKKPTEFFCASKSDINRVKKTLHYGNNDALVPILKEHGFDVPDDYFRGIDRNGNYRGERITPAMAKYGSLEPEILDEVFDEQTVQSAMAARSGSTTYYIPLKLYVYSDGGARAMTDAEIHEQLRIAQRLFTQNGVPFVFYVKCIVDEINSADFYDLSDNTNDVSNMFTTHYDPDAINVHVVSVGTSNLVNGEGERGGNRTWIARNATGNYQRQTLAHELGHNFGLEHTFDGVSCNEFFNGDCAACTQEPVSRTRVQPTPCIDDVGALKCSLDGDQLCDTPADPGLTNNNILAAPSCNRLTWNMGVAFPTADAWGQTWTPTTRNIMGISGNDCYRDFSVGQVGVMLSTITSFSFVQTSSSRTITGPTLLCSGQSYAYSTTNQGTGVSYQWVVPDGWTVTGNGSRNVTITPNALANTNHKINVIPICGNGVRPLSVTIDNNSLVITGPSSVADDPFPRTYSYYTEFYSGVSYNWSVPSGWSVVSGQGTFSVGVQAPANPNPGSVTVSSTVCGSPASGSKYVSVSGGGGGPPLLVAQGPGLFGPNPFTDQVTLMQSQGNEVLSDVVIIDINSSNIIHSQKSMSVKESMDLSKLPAGYYQINYVHNGIAYNQKLVKQ